MSKLKKTFKFIGVSILLLLIIGAIGSYVFLQNTKPKYNGERHLVSLKDSVEVYFDDYGIPHIYAQNSEDAYSALGYVHAQDRLFQMELIRRLSAGRLAEILGEDLVPTDKFFRTLGLRDMAEKSARKYLSGTNEQWQKDAKAYLRGVNEFIRRETEPIEFAIMGIEKTPFDEADIYSILSYMGLGFSQALREDHIWSQVNERLGSEYLEPFFTAQGMYDFDAQRTKEELQELSIVDEVEQHLKKIGLPIWYGSNGWVVSKEKSKTENVILANDTHIKISQPSVWYEAHLSYPGFDFYGNYIAGVPFAVLGHSRKLGWGLTIFPIDNMDLYREQYNENDSSQVKYNDTFVDLIEREEVIKVKDSEDVNHTVKSTIHGPILNDVSSTIGDNETHPVSLWWTYLQTETKAPETLFKLNHAQNIDDARAAASEVDFLGLNLLYGDEEGNIAHWACGKIPIRPSIVDSRMMLDGTTDIAEPIGYLPFAENPQEENPVHGYVASSNNLPGPEYTKKHPGYYCPPNRINRVRGHLENKEKFDVEDMKIIQGDEISDEHLRIAKVLVANWPTDASSISNSAKQRMADWDGGYEKEQVAPVIFVKLLYRMMEGACLDEFGAENFATLQNSYIYKGAIPDFIEKKDNPWWDNTNTHEAIETRQSILQNAITKSIQELEGQLGSDINEWQWKKVTSITHEHPLGRIKLLAKYFNVGPFSTSGSNDVPNKMMFTYNGDGEYKVTSSPALRIIHDFGNPDASISINPTGQSGNVMSKHYKDQAEMFINQEYRPQLMDRETIVGQSSKLMLRKYVGR